MGVQCQAIIEIRTVLMTRSSIHPVTESFPITNVRRLERDERPPNSKRDPACTDGRSSCVVREGIDKTQKGWSKFLV